MDVVEEETSDEDGDENKNRKKWTVEKALEKETSNERDKDRTKEGKKDRGTSSPNHAEDHNEEKEHHEKEKDEGETKTVSWNGLPKVINSDMIGDEKKSLEGMSAIEVLEAFKEEARKQKEAEEASETGRKKGRKKGAAHHLLDEEKQKFRQSFYWFAHNHKKIGFRHIVMLVLIVSYTLIGASIFYNLESNYELHTVHARYATLNEAVRHIARDIVLLNVNGSLPRLHEMEGIVKNAYIHMLEMEDRYKGSTFYKMDDPANNFKWTFGSSFFFSANLFTTVGYGSISCDTTAGQMVTIVYAMFGIPLTLVVIRDLGQFALVRITKVFPSLHHNGLPTFEDESIQLPLKFCLSLLLGYMIFATIFVYNYDALWGPIGSGIDFFHAFYFSFISLTTIGLGDIMPQNVPFSPVVAILFFFGMPIMKVINRVTYVAIENGVFASMTVLENALDIFWLRKAADVELGLPAASSAPPGTASPRVSRPHRPSIASSVHPSMASEEDEDGATRNELLNNFTVRSIATFMRQRNDVYGGDFGRVAIRTTDLS